MSDDAADQKPQEPERCPDCRQPVKYKPVDTTAFDGEGRERGRAPYCANPDCVMYGRSVNLG